MELDMVADMEVEKLVDMVVDMEIDEVDDRTNNNIFGKLRTSAFTWLYPGYLWKNSNLRKINLRLHSFGTFWTIATENQWEITDIDRLSCFKEFFVRFHIVGGRYTPDTI